MAGSITDLLEPGSPTAQMVDKMADGSPVSQFMGLLTVFTVLLVVVAAVGRAGALAGDDALHYFAAAIRGQLRPSDRCSRYGGDEFVLLLPGVDAGTALDILRRLQRVVVERTLVYNSGEMNLSFSAGVTVAEPGASLEATLHRADAGIFRLINRLSLIHI